MIINVSINSKLFNKENSISNNNAEVNVIVNLSD